MGILKDMYEHILELDPLSGQNLLNSRHFKDNGDGTVTYCRHTLITTEMIRREYALLHPMEAADHCKLTAADFPLSELRLSLDDFARNRGWKR